MNKAHYQMLMTPDSKRFFFVSLKPKLIIPHRDILLGPMAKTKQNFKPMQAVLCLLMCLSVFTKPAMSQSCNLGQITHVILQQLLNKIDSDLYGTNPIKLATTVRLAFHDCVSGCDGSVNLFGTQNRGLEDVMIPIHTAYETGPNAAYYQQYLSFADFIVLVTQRAVGHGMKSSGDHIPYVSNTPHFHYGRPHGPRWNADPVEAEIVDASDNWPAVLEFMQKHMAPVTENELIALMGLHAMGECKTHNSGYNGPWGPESDRNVISNHFFINMLGIGANKVNFVQRVVPEPDDPAPPAVFPSEPPEFDEIQWERTPENSDASRGSAESHMNQPRPRPNNRPPHPPQQQIGVPVVVPIEPAVVDPVTDAPAPETPAPAFAQHNELSEVEELPQIMLNTDMGIYLEFTADHGNATGKYCAQGKNRQLTNCSDPQKLRVHPVRGKLAHDFAWSNSLYLMRMQEAFIHMCSSLPEGQHTEFKAISPKKICVNGVEICLGDIFFSDCGGLNNQNCA